MLFNNFFDLQQLTGIVVEDDDNIYILFNFGRPDIFIDDGLLDLLYRLLFRKQKKTKDVYDKEKHYYDYEEYLQYYVMYNNFIGYIPRIVPETSHDNVAPSNISSESVSSTSVEKEELSGIDLTPRIVPETPHDNVALSNISPESVSSTPVEKEELSGIDLTTNNKKIILCGHSMGANVSLNLGYYIFKNDPDLFSRIIVIGTGAHLPLSKEKFEDTGFQNVHNQIFMYYSSMKLSETTYKIDCAFPILKDSEELKLPYMHVYLILSSEKSAIIEDGIVGYDYDEKDKNYKLYILLSNGQKIVPEYLNPPDRADSKCMHNLKNNYISKCAILFKYELEGGSSNKQKRKTKRRKNKKTKYRKTRRGILY